LKGSVTLLKATSYMTHRDEFSTIRGLILANSRRCCRTIRAFSYHFFTPDQWKVQVFGE